MYALLGASVNKTNGTLSRNHCTFKVLRQLRSKVLKGPCADIWSWALELVFCLKQYKMRALR